MTSMFKDFDKSPDDVPLQRYVHTPTIEKIYEVDSKAIDDFLDESKYKVKEQVKTIEAKDPDSLSGIEQLYLTVAKSLDLGKDYPVSGNEGLFDTLYKLLKRCLDAVSGFFKWMAETFFGFGKRSKTETDKLRTKIKMSEIKYDEDLTYPASAKLVLNSKVLKAYPSNIDWVNKGMADVIARMKGVEQTFTAASALFKHLQDQRVTKEQIAAFGNKVASALGGKVGKDANHVIGPVYFTVNVLEDQSIEFATVHNAPIDPKDSKFSVSESAYDKLADNLEATASALMSLAELTKKESTLFNVKIKKPDDFKGMGKAEAFLLAAGYRSLVNFTGFIKSVMSVLQRADTATHDIASKAFK